MSADAGPDHGPDVTEHGPERAHRIADALGDLAHVTHRTPHHKGCVR
ncbi:hypothetical protein AB0937_10130 [Streptomyces sp. NPDC047880]